MKPATNAPNTVKGIIIMKSTLRLKARPKELLKLFTQLGQAWAVIGFNITIAPSNKRLTNIFLIMVSSTLAGDQLCCLLTVCEALSQRARRLLFALLENNKFEQVLHEIFIADKLFHRRRSPFFL